jgi:hypothetical protein
MTPARRVDWLRFAFLFALAGGALAFACVIVAGALYVGAGVVEMGKHILAALWPWVQAHSDGLTIGLVIGGSLGIVLALALEGRR